MAPGDAARTYHELTSYDLARDWDAPRDDPRIVQGFTPNEVATFPAPCKTYPPGLPTVELPRTWATGGASATEVLAGQAAASGGTVDLATLARLLHLTAGVGRIVERPDGRVYRFRAAGSAGGQFPYELYVAARGVAGLEDGVHWFDPLRHALVRVGPAPGGEVTTIVVAGVPWRTGWRYAERGFRHLYWDAGTVLAHALAVADDAGLVPRLRTTFPDGEVARLIGADGVQEHGLVLLTLGDGEPAIRPGGQAAHGEIDTRAPVEFPLVTATQHAGDGDVLGPPRADGAPLGGAPPGSQPVDEVVRRRSSTRVFDPAGTVPRATAEWSLAAALRGGDVPHFVAVHAVEGLAPGIYRWPDLGRPLRAGDVRDEVFRVCLDQDLARDAAFVVIGAAELDALDDRGYRAAQLESGLVSGRLHLAAFGLGFGACGMTFLDSELPALLGEELAGLLFTCVGVPTYRARPGGPPLEPVLMRPVPRRPEPPAAVGHDTR